jgi:large subunit ribosomal protein L24
MKIKKGDTVIVISGADKGKSGKILHVYPKKGKVLVEGVNLKKRHRRSRRSGEKGQIIEKPNQIDASNVMFLDPKQNVKTRIVISREGGKSVRIAKKSGAVIEK